MSSEGAKKFDPVKWTFHGHVTPALPHLSLDLPTHGWRNSLGFSLELEGRIHESIVLVRVTQFDPIDTLTLRNDVRRDIQVFVDIVCLFTGAGLDVELISAQADHGQWEVFDGFIPMLRREGEFDLTTPVISAVGSEPAAQGALADFREAMRVPVQTGFFCYRAIEAAMQSFKSSVEEKDAAAWDRFREALNISRPAVDNIKAHADWARHGKAGHIKGVARGKILRATQVIVTRYVDYLTKGKVPLDREEYPLLTSD